MLQTKDQKETEKTERPGVWPFFFLILCVESMSEAEDLAQQLKRSPGKCEVLSSIPSTKKRVSERQRSRWRWPKLPRAVLRIIRCFGTNLAGFLSIRLWGPSIPLLGVSCAEKEDTLEAGHGGHACEPCKLVG